MDLYGFDELEIRKLDFDFETFTVINENEKTPEGWLVAEEIEVREYLWQGFLKRDDNAYIVKIHGDSMTPDIEDGDKVIVVERDSYSNDDIVLVSINGKDILRCYILDGNTLWLAATNEKYRPIKVSSEDIVSIYGSVAQILKAPKIDKVKIAKLIKEEGEKQLPVINPSRPIPDVLTSKIANAQLKLLKRNQLLDENWQPVGDIPLWKLAGIADKLSEVLKITNKWVFFGSLWNKDSNSLRVKRSDTKDNKNEIEFRKKILDKIR